MGHDEEIVTAIKLHTRDVEPLTTNKMTLMQGQSLTLGHVLKQRADLPRQIPWLSQHVFTDAAVELEVFLR